MPKTLAELQALRGAIQDAMQASNAGAWPYSIAWLAGAWRADSERWEWDDGTLARTLPWATGQPSAGSRQGLQPWLCMAPDGLLHDSGQNFSFAVMCEAKGDQVRTAAHRRPRHKPGPYEFAGFALGPKAARQSCGKRHLAMPKTEAKQRALMSFIEELLADGRMTADWPNNTLWIGGHWSPSAASWVWDDGDPISRLDWAVGQPSSREDHIRELWLCMLSNGLYYDSDPGIPYYSFGVVCEAEDTGALIVEKSGIRTLGGASVLVLPTLVRGASFGVTATVVAGVFLLVHARCRHMKRSGRQLRHPLQLLEGTASSSESDLP